MDKVSIILLHYQQESYVFSALDSIFSQDYQNIEIVFADDATPNLNLATIKEYCKKHNKNHSKILWQINSNNLGTVKTANLAIKKSTGKYFLLFAADDKLASKSVISNFIKCFQTLPKNICAISGQCTMMDISLEANLYNFIDPQKAADFNQLTPFGQYYTFCKECFIAMGATCFRKDTIANLHLFDERYKYIEDWPSFLTLTANNYKFYIDCDNLALLHRDGGISHTNITEQTPPYLINFREELVAIFLDKVFNNFKKFNSHEKEQIYNTFIQNLNSCIACGGQFDAQKLKDIKFKNFVFFAKHKLINILTRTKNKEAPTPPPEKPKPIKVFFICQYQQGISKFYDVARIIGENSNFQLFLLVFPNDIHDKKEIQSKKYFFEWQKILKDLNGEIIDAATPTGWYILKKDNPDYIFVQRPYDIYLPKSYSLESLNQFVKICYIPYGYFLADMHEESNSEQAIKNYSLYFVDSEYEYSFARTIFSKSSDPDKHKAYNLGYPSLYNYIKKIPVSTSSFDSIKQRPFRIIWTPRWTADKTFGASSFFDFKDDIVKYIDDNDNINLVFRPHPMMFNNFIEKKQITKKAVKDYLRHYDGQKMIYDDSSDYFYTFIESDVLVTDFSSIIIEYMLLNKPIILCDTNEAKYTSVMQKIRKVCYLAHNWKEVQSILSKLRIGQDPLKTKRAIVSQSIIEQNKNLVSERIVEALEEDFSKT